METAQARVRVFEMYARDCADLPDEHPGIEVTPELAGRYVSELRDAGYRGKGDTRKKDLETQVVAWLTNPDRYSPFIDEIAVERAVAFDWSAFSSLTPAERREFGDRLAQMPNPLSEPEVLPNGLARRKRTRGVASDRRTAYHRGTETQQRSVRSALQAAQRRLAKAS